MPRVETLRGIIEFTRVPPRPAQRRAVLRVREGQVYISAPKYVSQAALSELVQQNADWITRQIERFHEDAQSASASDLCRTYVLLGGVRCPIVVSHANRSTITIEFVHDHIAVTLPDANDAIANKGQAQVTQAVAEALRRHAEREINRRVWALAAEHSFQPAHVSIRAQTSRWGSCSSSGTISINWRLIQAPPEILEYVILHELAHLRHPNHAKPFWDEVGRMFPDYTGARTWLRTHGHTLFAIDKCLAQTH